MKIKEQEIHLLRFIKRVALLFFPVLVALFSLSYYAYQNEVSIKQNALSSREKLNVSLEQEAIKKTFNAIVSDLLVLADHNDMGHMLNDPDDDLAVHHFGLTKEFLAFVNHKKVYDQLRLIDQFGQEIIRVEYRDGNATTTPKENLQNKGDRYYFKNTISLNPGSIYVSPFDLNMEHGKIEIPQKPVIRFGVPITNADGEKYGILMLNYLGNDLFHAVESVSSTAEGSVMLINSDGYWLKGLKAEDEWGFMYGDRQGRMLANQYAEAWEKISTTETGQFINSRGMFTYSTIYPLANSKEIEISVGNYYWKLISFVPSKSLFQNANTLKKTITVLITLLAIVWLIICMIIAYEKEKDYLNELAIREKDARIRDIVDTAFDAIITINENGLISSFNKAASNMFGYDESEAIGNSINMIVPSPHKEMHDNYVARYIETREAHIIKKPREVDALKKDGSLFPVELCVGAKELDGKWLFTGILRDITERKKLKTELEKMATTDALTGLYNRGHFNQTFENEFRRSTRYDLPLSLIIMDADHFKSVNDEYGHPAGDAFLIALGKEITRAVREIDIVARYGGEEFVVILPQTGSGDALVLAERIRSGIEKMKIEYDGEEINRTVSIGLVSLKKGESKSTEQLLNLADQALYKAKETGRNKVVKA